MEVEELIKNKTKIIRVIINPFIRRPTAGHQSPLRQEIDPTMTQCGLGITISR